MRATLALAAVSLLWAHDPVTTKLTWSAEISRIVFRRCAACHREGGPAPMALTNYEQIRPWAKAIRDEVLARRMPPWGAIKGYGEFQGDRSLTQDEITRIAEWVEGGAPEGDPRYLPTTAPAKLTEPAIPRGTRVKGPLRLTRPVRLLAISPAGDVPSAKIYARLPDGSMEPLLWAFGYRQKWRRTFVFSRPVDLPAGTVVEASQNVHFDVIMRTKTR